MVKSFSRAAVAVALAFAILLLPGVASAYCINESWEGSALIVNGSPELNGEYCPYGCTSELGYCTNPYEVTPLQASVSLVIFMFLFGLALVFFIYGYERKLISIMLLGIIILMVLAVQAFAFGRVFLDTPFSSMTYILVMLCLGLAIVGFIIILGGAVERAGEAVSGKRPGG